MAETETKTPFNDASIWDNGTPLLSKTFLTYVSMKISEPSGAPTPEIREEIEKEGWKFEFEHFGQDDKASLVMAPYVGISTSSASSAYARVFNPQGESVRHSNPEYIQAVIVAENKL